MYTLKCGFLTSRVCDQSIMMMIVRYFWCVKAQAAVMLGLTSISRLQKSRAGWSLFSSYVCVAMPKAGGRISSAYHNVWEVFF